MATIKLPSQVQEPHPDLLALAAYSVAWPWASRRMRFDRPISAEMMSAFVRSGIEASGPKTAGTTEPRTAGGRLSLAYSSGADSIAVAEILPDDTAFVHLRRIKHPRVVNRMTHVRVDVIEGLARRASEFGRDVSVVQTDLEYLCLPYATYPVWWAISIGSILMADETDAGGVALGTVLESRYTANGTKWVGSIPPSATHYLYEAAGIPIVRPGAGMTEVITTKLSLESDLHSLARSCLLGSSAGPCLNCDKCLRKEMTTAAVTGGGVSKHLLDNMRRNPRMLAKMLVEPPMYFQDMVEYALARLDVSGTPLQQVKNKLNPTVAGTDWAERYYLRALEDEVPEVWRPKISAAISSRVEPMSVSDTDVVETWDAERRGVVE